MVDDGKRMLLVDPSEERINHIEPVILELLAVRGADKTICPSEVARRMAELAGYPERWQAWLNRTRATAILMAERGSLVISQRGQRVDPANVRGAIRLGLPDA